ncbi:UDP-GlcNAc--UDP-phosphate GlcNAc-1-phosphate transferase [Lacihabitans sp. LS3-19]|uniref:UDP-GlcNAc--UDP-phosphate GlcNAc-1-phosphate transferase n=1 Tax=Lacihabitans sp. LS3-19 TaxID=2487335 RepID=UPI0020CC3924|nr:UDP-GlcNAc--UDP-phosphate GlcNAc-1-phosphate transferase [Lacihabitans sp. LS3-19]MCP9769397.1 UDP-GlcNAc--UDP-phosphate GlcNAc-1-phosphate transferase [Lacihabitans sp. LS3-19]
MTYFVFLIILFFVSELIYIRIAQHFNIIDFPNNRSSHKENTIRGIGIVFLFAAFHYFFNSGFQYSFFFAGLFLVGTVSFFDDIRPLANRFRIIIQFISVGLLIFQIKEYFVLDFLILFVLLLVIGVGILNAYNFMDGINGITGTFSLVTIGSLYIINRNFISFIDDNLLVNVGLSICVFLFFNFRTNAIGFCGDVGSVSIAFIILFTIAMLIFKTNNVKFIFFLGVYGIDTIYTLLYRMQKKENIFKAHRSHFFQILVHDYKFSHLQVSFLFSIIQLMLNIWIVYTDLFTFYFYIPFIIITSILHYYRNKKGYSIRVFTFTK